MVHSNGLTRTSGSWADESYVVCRYISKYICIYLRIHIHIMWHWKIDVVYPFVQYLNGCDFPWKWQKDLRKIWRICFAVKCFLSRGKIYYFWGIYLDWREDDVSNVQPTCGSLCIIVYLSNQKLEPHNAAVLVRVEASEIDGDVTVTKPCKSCFRWCIPFLQKWSWKPCPSVGIYVFLYENMFPFHRVV